MTTQTAPVLPHVRAGRTSWRLNRRALAVAVAAGVVLVVVTMLDIAKGDVPLSIGQVIASLTGSGTVETDVVVYDLRLPQTVVAVATGAALGIAGGLTQTFARNPLATPDILGINNGAAVGAVLFIVLQGTSTGERSTGLLGTAGVSLAALVGAVLAAIALALLAGRRAVDSQRLVLIGIGLSAALAAVTSWLLTTARLHDASNAQLWLTGSLANRGWVEALPVLVMVLVAIPLLLILSPTLDAIQLGPDSARGLGVRLDAAQLTLLGISVVLAAVSVAAVGPLGFVAFLSPQLARRLAGTARPPLASAMLTGASLVVLADLVSRVILPTPLAAGILTSVIGAPYFIYLLLRTNRRTSA